MVTDRNTKLTAFLLGLAGILMSVAAVAEDRILITTEFPDEFTCELCVIEQAAGGSGGDSFISGGPELNEPQQIVFGPDDNLYVLDEQENATKGGAASEMKRTPYCATTAAAAVLLTPLSRRAPTV